MADIPVFGADQIDQNPNNVSLSAVPTQDRFWSDWFLRNAQNPNQFALPPQSVNQEQARLEQQRVIQDLQRQAAGDMNSLAQGQLRQGYGAAQAQQASLGSTMRGQGAGAAMRGIQQGQQGIQRGFAGDQQMLKLQEQQAAQAMLAQMLEQQRGQDFAFSQSQAQNTLGANALNDARRQFYMQAGIQSDVAANQLAQERARAQLGFDLESQNLTNAFNQQVAGAAQGFTGTLSATPWGRPRSGYRQVEGQDSIVPEWDK